MQKVEKSFSNFDAPQPDPTRAFEMMPTELMENIVMVEGIPERCPFPDNQIVHDFNTVISDGLISNR